MRLDINLASRPFVNRLPQGLLIGSLLAGALGLTAWNVATVARSATEARAVAGQLATLKEEESLQRAKASRLQATLIGVPIAPLQLKATAANEVLAQKALSWSLLLERLEELLPWRAALRSVDASVSADGVGLTMKARAASQAELLEFIDALERSPCFADAYPGDEGMVAAGGFDGTITVGYDPYCGNAPEIPGGKKARGSITRRGGRRG